jgi:hypothetical protein
VKVSGRLPLVRIFLSSIKGPRSARPDDPSDDELDAVITEGLRRQLAAGVTTVRDLGDLRYAVVNRRDVQRAGRTREAVPTIVASGPPLTSVGGHCHFLGGEAARRSG